MSEKKFNNSIEKSEELAQNSVKRKAANKAKNAAAVRADENAQNNAPATKKVKKSNNEKQIEKLQKAKKAESEKQKAKKAELEKRREKERERALKREEAAKIRQEKREKAKQAKLAKKQAAERKKAAIKELKIKKREERLARRDALRHESKQQRRERILAEKAQKNQLKREKREQKAEMHRQKLEAKRERARLIAAQKREKQKTNSARGLGGWLAAVIALGCCVLVLSTVLVWNVFMTNGGENMLSSVYQQSFYDLLGYVDNIDVNLSKLGISNDNGQSQKLLNEVSLQANLAETDLTALPLQDESRFYTVKFINQLGDFSKYLSNKLIDGEEMSEEDKNTLSQFKKINAELKSELNELAQNMGENFNFLSLLSGEADNALLEKFNELQSNAVDYPQMIYDGPFADKPQKTGGDKKAVQKITEDQAKSVFVKTFADYKIGEVKIQGEINGEEIQAYNLVAEASKAQLSARISFDGKVVDFNWYKDCSDVNYSRDECIEKAYAFLEKLGYKSIKAVWTTQTGTNVYVNFAAFENDVVVYADMVKVTVCAERGVVSAMDAQAYIINHKERDLGVPSITVESAEKKLSVNLEVETSRLAYIPLPNGKEKLAYEFWGNAQDGEYYVYVDAKTGRELQIFKVVSTDEGTLLL